MARPDLDSPEQISQFIDDFYARVLLDPLLAPLFLEVARIDLAVHLPRIKAYWCKMLLREDGYRRHMMRKHRDLDRQQKLQATHYQRWLELFEETLANGYVGPFAERAGELARRVAGNMRWNLAQVSANT
jgi:hemoglobin